MRRAVLATDAHLGDRVCAVISPAAFLIHPYSKPRLMSCKAHMQCLTALFWNARSPLWCECDAMWLTLLAAALCCAMSTRWTRAVLLVPCAAPALLW
jgi:hypothetical protein